VGTLPVVIGGVKVLLDRHILWGYQSHDAHRVCSFLHSSA
jgi:hypothetical protein